MPSETTTLRPGARLYVVLAIGELVATAGAVLAFLAQGVTWTTIGLGCLALACSAGFAAAAASRIELTADALRVGGLLGGRSISRRDVTSANVVGDAVRLQRQNGSWFTLPKVGYASRDVLETVRAWLDAR